MKLQKLFVPALLALSLAACGKGDQAAPGASGPGAAMPAAEVDVVAVATGQAILTRELPGRLEAVRSAQVRARVEGIVEKRLFAEGSDIKAGTPLYRLDARTYRTAADAADADAAVARQTLARYKPLLDIKAVSRQEYDQAAAKVKQAEAALAKAKLDLENANVLAPISGRVGRSLVTEGALVGRGEATQLTTIEQIDPIYANFTQTNADVLRLQSAIKAGRLKRADGAKVELILDDGSVYPHAGKLQFSDLAVDPNTGSIQMRALFPNPERTLLPGTFVRVRFPEAVEDGAIRVPQRAVQITPQGNLVMTVDAENKVALRPVTLGSMAGADWIIAEGLKPGDKVIVNGLQKARPGSVVKPVLLGATAEPAGAEPAPAKP